MPQKRQASDEVVSRLQRRLDHYRKHQSDCIPRFNNSFIGLTEQNNLDTLSLKQRYLESKGKRAAKKTEKKLPDNPLQGLHAVSQFAPKRNDDGYDDGPPSAKRQCDNFRKFSVEIVQQLEITTSASHPQISANVTVNTLVKSDTPALSTSPQPQAPVECKQEHVEDPGFVDLEQCAAALEKDAALEKVAAAHGFSDIIGDETSGAIISSDAFKDLISEISEYPFMSDFDFDNGDIKLSDQSQSQHQQQTFKSEDGSKAPQQRLDQQQRLYTSPGMDFVKTELSPAAQTLKQMAEQHQHKLGMTFNPAAMRPPAGGKPYSDFLGSPPNNAAGGGSQFKQLPSQSPKSNFVPSDDIKQEVLSAQNSPGVYSPGTPGAQPRLNTGLKPQYSPYGSPRAHGSPQYAPRPPQGPPPQAPPSRSPSCPTSTTLQINQAQQLYISQAHGLPPIQVSMAQNLSTEMKGITAVSVASQQGLYMSPITSDSFSSVSQSQNINFTQQNMRQRVSMPQEKMMHQQQQEKMMQKQQHERMMHQQHQENMMHQQQHDKMVQQQHDKMIQQQQEKMMQQQHEKLMQQKQKGKLMKQQQDKLMQQQLDKFMQQHQQETLQQQQGKFKQQKEETSMQQTLKLMQLQQSGKLTLQQQEMIKQQQDMRGQEIRHQEKMQEKMLHQQEKMMTPQEKMVHQHEKLMHPQENLLHEQDKLLNLQEKIIPPQLLRLPQVSLAQNLSTEIKGITSVSVAAQQSLYMGPITSDSFGSISQSQNINFTQQNMRQRVSMPQDKMIHQQHQEMVHQQQCEKMMQQQQQHETIMQQQHEKLMQQKQKVTLMQQQQGKLMQQQDEPSIQQTLNLTQLQQSGKLTLQHQDMLKQQQDMREQVIRHQEKMLHRQDKMMTAQEKMVHQHEKLMHPQENMLHQQDKLLHPQEKIMHPQLLRLPQLGVRPPPPEYKSSPQTLHHSMFQQQPFAMSQQPVPPSGPMMRPQGMGQGPPCPVSSAGSTYGLQSVGRVAYPRPQRPQPMAVPTSMIKPDWRHLFMQQQQQQQQQQGALFCGSDLHMAGGQMQLMSQLPQHQSLAMQQANPQMSVNLQMQQSMGGRPPVSAPSTQYTPNQYPAYSTPSNDFNLDFLDQSNFTGDAELLNSLNFQDLL